MKKTSSSSKKKSLREKIFCQNNLLRDFVILLITLFFSSLLVASNYYTLSVEKKIAQKKIEENLTASSLPPIAEEEIYQEVKAVQETIDTSAWKDYQNQWYGIALKHPGELKTPLSQKKLATDKWSARYQFRFTDKPEEFIFSGFDLVVYQIPNVAGLLQTEEFPRRKNTADPNNPACQTIDGHIIETGDYPAEEIYIGSEDDCFEKTLFFSFTRENYLYILTPQFKDTAFFDDPRVELVNGFPEFFSIASTLSIIDIVRPKPLPPKPKITAPRPVSFKKDAQGRLVCAKKNDKPSKSDKNKKKHLDMECCLDLDEYPNPHCYYDPAKYGKYLK